MQPRYGIFFSTFNEYESSINNLEKYGKLFCIFPFQVIKENLSQPLFMKASNIVGLISVVIDINNFNEVELCSYLSLTNLYFDVNDNDLYDTATKILALLSKYKNIKFIARINNYETWSILYSLCRYHPNLYVSPILPTNFNQSKIWKTASLYSFILTSSHFEEDFTIKKSNINNITFLLIRGANLLITYESIQNMNQINSINKLIEKVPISYSLSHFQQPMETISVNLPSYSYEIFETDKQKYFLYQKSIEKAVEKLRFKKEIDKIFLAVVGAGRGPLVDCAVRCGIKNIFIVEKNPGAIELLKQRKSKGDWPKDSVKIFSGDIRSISFPEKVDIIVSELLGSIGDNELAPECLKYCENKINKENGIMIPQSFSSVFVPVMSEFLWAKALNEEKFQNILVIPLDTALFIADSQVGFEFFYPENENKNVLYKRKHFTFGIKCDAVCHGVGGWFNSTLFDDVVLSTSPIDGDSDVFSWFPVFIPFENPFKVSAGQKIEFVMERKGNNQKVWYEWAVVGPVILPIQNFGGSHCFIGLNSDI